MQPDFSRQLIKGKIAEVVFEQMFRDTGRFTVIPFGYETVMPELMQYAMGEAYRDLVDNIRNAPDFAIVSHNPDEVFLVEVKYRPKMNAEDVRKYAKVIYERWKLAWLFYATPEGFFLGKCTDLLGDDSRIRPLDERFVSRDIQDRHLLLLREFLGNRGG